MVHIQDFRLAHRHSGLGASAEPRISWRYSNGSGDSNSINWLQTGYDIEVHGGNRAPKEQVYKVTSSSSASEPWPGEPLSSREMVVLRVKAHGTSSSSGRGQKTKAVSTPWSQWLTIEAGLLDPADWSAGFITSIMSPAKAATVGTLRPIRLRKGFKLNINGPESKARLYITALGLYVAYLNGERVGDQHMTPGYTSYRHRLQYQSYDISSLLNPDSDNVLAIEIAEGWYAGEIAWDEHSTSLYGNEIGVLAQLEICFASESEPILTIRSDETWESQLSPILGSGIWAGETYDGRLEKPDWNRCIPPDSDHWHSVKAMAFPSAQLVADSAPGVKMTQIVKPVRVFQSASGKSLVGFGQNLAGKVQIHHLKRPLGHRVQMRHAEVLENGEISVRPLRGAKATDTVIFGHQDELNNWSVHFTYHGFRYVEFEGWGPQDATDPLTVESLSALVMHTDMDRTGFFECSNDMVNRLHENVVWSMRSNFISIPTDCPQRDERMGWTGDIQVFAPTSSFLYDCDGMLSNWMRDVLHEQQASNGIVPFVVPNCLADWKWPSVAQAVWDDVVVLVPWVLYVCFGDVETLQQSYSGMKDYLDKSIPRGEDGLWDQSVWQLGDWLDPNAPPQEPGLAWTDGTLVADEYLIHVIGIMAKIAGVVGQPDDAKRYGAARDRLLRSFRDKYMAPSGLIVGDSQTSLALALVFSLHDAPETPWKRDLKLASNRAEAAKRLARLVRYAKFRVSTGFVGTPAVLHALSSSGHLQVAYRMLLEEHCPSWLYAVKMGGTTMWERWDSLLPDGSVNPGAMTSFNHYALGAVGNWLHEVVGGLAPSSTGPGWRRFIVQPRPGGNITSAKVDFKSPCGRIICEWNITSHGEAQMFHMRLVVPPNSTALVLLPRGKLVQDVEARQRYTDLAHMRLNATTRQKDHGPPAPYSLSSGVKHDVDLTEN